jgi:hemolysin activation/secretion protein
VQRGITGPFRRAPCNWLPFTLKQVAAVAATALHAQQRHLMQQQLAAAQALKQQTFEQLQAQKAQRATKEQHLSQWAMRYAQCGDISKFKLGGEQERETVRQQVLAQLTQLLVRQCLTMPELVTYMQTQSYPPVWEPGKPMQIFHQETKLGP